MNGKPHAIVFLLFFPLLFNGTDSYAKKMYRWVDENGRVYFSDQVPPDQVKHERETLSEKNRVVDKLEKAKTPEELAQQKRLEVLRQEQEKVIAKQAASDKVLLATYRSLDDINRALANKLALMDSEKKGLEGNKQRLEQQLQKQQQQAATIERNGQKVSEKLLQDMAATRKQIDSSAQELARHEQKRLTLEQEFKADIARFTFLNQVNSADKTRQDTRAANNNNELGLFVCQDAAQCENAWKIAGEFVYQNATTGRDVETERLIMSAAPVADEDLSLSVTKLGDAKAGQIFLDIRCKSSNIGQELCGSEKILAIRRSFAGYIQQHLTPQQ